MLFGRRILIVAELSPPLYALDYAPPPFLPSPPTSPLSPLYALDYAPPSSIPLPLPPPLHKMQCPGAFNRISMILCDGI